MRGFPYDCRSWWEQLSRRLVPRRPVELVQDLPRGLTMAMSGSHATQEELAEAIETAFSPLD